MKKVKVLLFASVFCLLFGGCAGGKEDPPITGGVTDNTDYDAPKVIESKTIVDFATRFYAYDKYDYDKGGFYDVRIAPNEKDELVFTINGIYSHAFVVDASVLVDVQEIIDAKELVKMNGGGRVTAGLPCEYEPWMLSVNYDSGEKLYFHENGAPEADWTSAFRDYFVNLMAEAGFEDALPSKEAITIEDFSLAFDRDGEYHVYSITAKGDDTRCLWHSFYRMETEDPGHDAYAAVTEELFTGLQEVIASHQMDVLHAPETVHFDFEPRVEGFLQIYIDYENSRQIYGEYGAEELPENWPEMKAALIEYLDAYMQNHPSAEID